jgi:predicted kinase
MKTEGKTKVVTATGALLKALEKAGELQIEANDAKVAYEKHRAKLVALFKEHGIKDDVAVYGTTTWAIHSHDHHDNVDPIDFIDAIKDKKARRACLKVLITKLREELKSDKETLTTLISHDRDDHPTLHVNKIKEED